MKQFTPTRVFGRHSIPTWQFGNSTQQFTPAAFPLSNSPPHEFSGGAAFPLSNSAAQHSAAQQFHSAIHPHTSFQAAQHSHSAIQQHSIQQHSNSTQQFTPTRAWGAQYSPPHEFSAGRAQFSSTQQFTPAQAFGAQGQFSPTRVLGGRHSIPTWQFGIPTQQFSPAAIPLSNSPPHKLSARSIQQHSNSTQQFHSAIQPRSIPTQQFNSAAIPLSNSAIQQHSIPTWQFSSAAFPLGNSAIQQRSIQQHTSFRGRTSFDNSAPQHFHSAIQQFSPAAIPLSNSAIQPRSIPTWQFGNSAPQHSHSAIHPHTSFRRAQHSHSAIQPRSNSTQQFTPTRVRGAGEGARNSTAQQFHSAIPLSNSPPHKLSAGRAQFSPAAFPLGNSAIQPRSIPTWQFGNSPPHKLSAGAAFPRSNSPPHELGARSIQQHTSFRRGGRNSPPQHSHLAIRQFSSAVFNSTRVFGGAQALTIHPRSIPTQQFSNSTAQHSHLAIQQFGNSPPHELGARSIQQCTSFRAAQYSHSAIHPHTSFRARARRRNSAARSNSAPQHSHLAIRQFSPAAFPLSNSPPHKLSAGAAFPLSNSAPQQFHSAIHPHTSSGGRRGRAQFNSTAIPLSNSAAQQFHSAIPLSNSPPHKLSAGGRNSAPQHSHLAIRQFSPAVFPLGNSAIPLSNSAPQHSHSAIQQFNSTAFPLGNSAIRQFTPTRAWGAQYSTAHEFSAGRAQFTPAAFPLGNSAIQQRSIQQHTSFRGRTSFDNSPPQHSHSAIQQFNSTAFPLGNSAIRQFTPTRAWGAQYSAVHEFSGGAAFPLSNSAAQHSAAQQFHSAIHPHTSFQARAGAIQPRSIPTWQFGIPTQQFSPAAFPLGNSAIQQRSIQQHTSFRGRTSFDNSPPQHSHSAIQQFNSTAFPLGNSAIRQFTPTRAWGAQYSAVHEFSGSAVFPLGNSAIPLSNSPPHKLSGGAAFPLSNSAAQHSAAQQFHSAIHPHTSLGRAVFNSTRVFGRGGAVFGRGGAVFGRARGAGAIQQRTSIREARCSFREGRCSIRAGEAVQGQFSSARVFGRGGAVFGRARGAGAIQQRTSFRGRRCSFREGGCAIQQCTSIRGRRCSFREGEAVQGQFGSTRVFGGRGACAGAQGQFSSTRVREGRCSFRERRCSFRAGEGRRGNSAAHEFGRGGAVFGRGGAVFGRARGAGAI